MLNIDLHYAYAVRFADYQGESFKVLGATPEDTKGNDPAFGEIAGRLLNPALHSVNSGVRGYYFALAAAAWLFGPWTFIAATLGVRSKRCA